MDTPPNLNSATNPKLSWKQRLRREFITYGISSLYLAIFFGVFAWYRRFILAEYEISYLNYGSAIIEALVLAKVVWLGEKIGLVRDRDDKPLLYPTIQKACVFTIFFCCFAILERMIGGIIEGIGAKAGFMKLWHEGLYELLARCMVTFCAFLPFFAFRELARQLGQRKLWELFFGRRSHGDSTEFGAPA